MANLDMKLVSALKEDILVDVNELISNYFQTYHSERVTCNEKEMAMACQLVRQQYRGKISIRYKQENPLGTRFTYHLENKTLE